MKDEKKENLVAKQRYIEVRKRNIKLSRINVGIIGVGLLLRVLGHGDIGVHFIWLGIIILIYTIGSNMMAKMAIKKAR